MEEPKSNGGARKLERTQRAIEEPDGQKGSREQLRSQRARATAPSGIVRPRSAVLRERRRPPPEGDRALGDCAAEERGALRAPATAGQM